jgi:alpha-1,3-fucosyltransferase
LPQNRSLHQRYVFWLLESADWTEALDTKPLGHFFNWTLTYRWDSDMVMRYGYVRPTGNVPLHLSDDQMKELLSNQKVNYATTKTKMAAWMVSNCGSHSSRNEMVNIIKKYIQVDVYGACGTMSCPKEVGVDNSSEDCRDMVGKTTNFTWPSKIRYVAITSAKSNEPVHPKYVMYKCII